MKLIFCLVLLCSTSVLANSTTNTIVLNTSNSCSINGPINARSMKSVKWCLVKKVMKRGYSRYPIYLSIDSPGGSIFTGLAFIEFAKTIPGLHTINIRASSMAAAIIQHLPGTRYYRQNSLTMFHRARATISGHVENGELESRLAMVKRVIRKSEMVQAKRMYLTLRQYKYRIINEWWIHGDEHLKHSVGDEKVIVKCSISLIKSKRKQSVRTMFGSFKREISDCPLVN